MDTNRLLDASERGTHLLFDRELILDAFAQGPDDLRGVVRARAEAIQAAVEQLLALGELGEARRFLRALPREIRHVIVRLYFELLDGRVRARARLH
jgi:hypothetical protein